MTEPSPPNRPSKGLGTDVSPTCDRQTPLPKHNTILPQGLRRKAQDLLRTLPQQGKTLGTGLTNWFKVDEAEMAAILAQIRDALPTTEVLLIGKPQTGKSSIIRGLTGVSSDIIGQGFRPHTAHTQHYAYPTPDLPLLIFTDTIGLGEGHQDAATIVSELLPLQGTGSVPEDSTAPAVRVIILTLKITDFATDFLQQLIRQIRHTYPQIPCLLAVTCLHELYPPSVDNHPTYPPDYPDLQRSFAALQEQFAHLYDRAVLVDFTCEGDGYEPTFYGIEAFVDTLATLLPEAEARVIHQLLDQVATDTVGGLYRDAGRRYILPFSIMAATLAAVPIPLATMPVLTALQITLVSLLGRLYGQTLTRAQAGGFISAIAGGFLAQAIGRELIKVIPGLGSLVAASWAGAYTWALGEGACIYFGDLMGDRKPDPQKIQQTMRQSFQEAQEHFKTAVWSPQTEEKTP